MAFSICVGTGVQVFAMIFCLLFFCCIGIYSTQYRGAILSSLYIFLILLSCLSGYYSARFYKMFGGSDWLLCALLVSFCYPSFLFAIFLIINFSNWIEQSSAAVPFPTIVVLLFIYSALSVPNVWLGAFIGFKKTTIKVNIILLMYHFILEPRKNQQAIKRYSSLTLAFENEVARSNRRNRSICVINLFDNINVILLGLSSLNFCM